MPECWYVGNPATMLQFRLQAHPCIGCAAKGVSLVVSAAEKASGPSMSWLQEHAATPRFWSNHKHAMNALLQPQHPWHAPTEQTSWPDAGSQANQTGLVALRASQAYERMIQCVMTALDRNPLDFAACIPHFLTLYCDTALVTMDAATVHSIRAKRRVLLTRFLARALLSPFYRQEWLLSPVPGSLVPHIGTQLLQPGSFQPG